jgi:hypothetical protein
MKKFLLFPLALLLTSCAHTVPVTAKFPDVPPTFKETCDPLNPADRNDPKLSDLMVVVTENYVKYYDCKRKNQAWQEWYDQQKEIFEKATKK